MSMSRNIFTDQTRSIVLPVLVVACLAFILFFLVFRTSIPIAIDTAFMIDTTFLAILGWRGVNGLSPVVDYWHFYGGFTAANVTLAFKLFGVSLKSVDYSFVLIFIWATLLLALLSWGRQSFLTFCLLLLVTAAIILGPLSIEDGYLRYVNHSYVYNHFAMTVVIAITIFVTTPHSGSPNWDSISAFVAGFALFLLFITKSTFFVIAPFMFAACLIQRQYRVVGLMLVGLVAALLTLDPGAVKFLGSLEEITKMGQIERAGGLVGRMNHAVLTIGWHGGYILIAGYFVWRLWTFERGRIARPMVAILLCTSAFGAATLSMNGRPDLMLLPMIIAIMTLIADWLKPDHKNLATLAYVMATAMAFVLVIPAVYFSVDTWLSSDEAQSRQLITDGPFSSYMVLDPANPAALLNSKTIEQRRESAVTEAVARLSAGGPDRSTDPYVVLSDGVNLLNKIPNISKYGIITRGSLFDFTVPLRSKPVPSFPVWPLERSTSFLDMSEVDMVMAVRHFKAPDHLPPDAAAIVERDFHVCMSSAFFTLSVRRAATEIPCTGDDSEESGTSQKP